MRPLVNGGRDVENPDAVGNALDRVDTNEAIRATFMAACRQSGRRPKRGLAGATDRSFAAPHIAHIWAARRKRAEVQVAYGPRPDGFWTVRPMAMLTVVSNPVGPRLFAS